MYYLILFSQHFTRWAITVFSILCIKKTTAQSLSDPPKVPQLERLTARSLWTETVFLLSPLCGVPRPPPLSPSPDLGHSAVPTVTVRLRLPHPVTHHFLLPDPLSLSRTLWSTLQCVQRGPSDIWGHTSFHWFPEPVAQSAFKGGHARLSVRWATPVSPAPFSTARRWHLTTRLSPSISGSSPRTRCSLLTPYLACSANVTRREIGEE